PRVTYAMELKDASQLAPLAATVRSLTSQIYTDWQLLITASQEVEMRARTLLAQPADREGRIRCLENRGSLVNAVKGEWLGWLKPGDVLTADALFEEVYQLNRRAEFGPGVSASLARRANSGEWELNQPPIVVEHAPCPQIELETVRSVLVVKLDHLGD